MKLTLLAQQITESVCFPNGPAQQQRGHHQDERSRPVLDLSEQVHAAIDDENIQSPEQEKREPLRWRMSADWTTEQVSPSWNDRGEQSVESFAANPCLNAEPTTGDDGAHQRRQIRSIGSVRSARENRKGYSILCSGMRVEEDWNQNDRIAE